MSALLAAKQATFALLQTHSWPTPTPTISWGGPSKSEDTNTLTGEHVFLAQANIVVPAESLRLGRRSYDEECVIRVVIEVYQSGDQEQACEERADVLYEEVVEAFSADPYLGGTVDRLAGWTSNRALAPWGDGWRCQITVEQSCAKKRNVP